MVLSDLLVLLFQRRWVRTVQNVALFVIHLNTGAKLVPPRQRARGCFRVASTHAVKGRPTVSASAVARVEAY